MDKKAGIQTKSGSGCLAEEVYFTGSIKVQIDD